MRSHTGFLFAAILASTLVGCEDDGVTQDDYASTVDTFTGRLVQDGNPVDFSGDKRVVLQLIWREKAEQFGIPIKPDGTFQIGFMPLGTYSAILDRQPASTASERGRSSTIPPYTIPDGLTIEQGKTDYTIELGKNWKP